MFKDRYTDSGNYISKYRGGEKVRKVYPHLSKQEIDELINQCWERGKVYHPFFQYTEAPGKGRFVNVHPAGFRYSIAQGPWPPQSENFNIFLLGGSTLFGYGVSDTETISSQLQAELQKKYPGIRIFCYNFGQGAFYSSLERAMFEEFLIKGYRPDLVVFFDGLNEFLNSQPLLTPLFSAITEPLSRKEIPVLILGRIWWEKSAINRLLNAISYRLFRTEFKGSTLRRNEIDSRRDIASERAQRYIENQKMIRKVAKEYGIPVIFVWQPVPYVFYDRKYHLFAPEKESPYYPLYDQGYRLIREKIAEPDFLNLDHIQLDIKKNLYVDEVHYSPEFIQLIVQYMQKAVERYIEEHIQNGT